MLQICQNILRFLALAILVHIELVLTTFNPDFRNFNDFSQVYHNDIRDHLIVYPVYSIDSDWEPKGVLWYSVLEQNFTDQFRESYLNRTRFARGLARVNYGLQSKQNIADYTIRSGRIKVIKKKKKRRKKKKKRVRGAQHHWLHIVKFAKLIFAKYMTSLLVAFKLKFLAIFPVLAMGLFLIVGSAGLAGFFFALLLASMGLKGWAYY